MVTRAARAVVVSTFIALALLAGTVAWAYWRASGTGSSSGAVGTFAPPTAVTAVATPADNTVTVGWAGVASAPNGGAVDGYYIQRYAGAVASPACSTSAASLMPSTATACTDITVPDGTYTYVVTAVWRSWTSASTASASVTIDAVSQFLVTIPTNTTAGTAFTATVTARDAANATVIAYRGTVTFSSSDANSPVLPADYTFVAGDNGVHTFTTGVTLFTKGSQTVVAVDVVASSRTGSGATTVAVGAASQVTVTVQPTNTAATASITPSVAVAIQDVGGNTVTTSSATVAVSIGTNPGGGTLSGTVSKAATAGVATFTNLSINKTGTGYTLVAASTGLTTATSAAFNVTPGAATKVAYTAQPTAVVAGVAISPSVAVTVQDASGNTVTGSSATIALTIGTNPGGGTLSGTLSKAATAGVATFSDLSINKTGTGYTLVAASTGLTSATSSAFNVTPAGATALGVATQPGGGTGGIAWVTQPSIKVVDGFGNTVTTSSASITLAISSGTGTAGAALTCTANPKAAAAGVDAFAGCKIDKSGTGYTLTATSTGLTSVITSSFNVTVGAAAKLVYTQQPTAIVAGASISPSVVAVIQDAGGNVVTSSSATVTIAIGTNPGGGVLSGTASQAASSGVATFPGISINKVGTGYTLVVSSTGLTSATSSTFNVTVGAAANLVFTTTPNGGVANAVWTTQPKVTITDANGNTVTTSTASVTLAITSGTGAAGATLTCTANPKAATAGVDTFAGCKINTAGTGYTLLATATGLSSATSGAFNIT